MKFLSLAVAAFLGMTEGKKTLSSTELKTRMVKGQFNKETLMRGARPYGETARKLEQQQQQEQAWEINGLYSVQFSSCITLTVQDDDLFNENYLTYAQEGFVKAGKSYILFTTCQSSDCYYQADDQKLTFITDIASFFQAFSDFLPNQVENYCEGCNQNYDYCMGNLDANADAAAADDAAAAEGDAAAAEGDAAAEDQGQEQQADQGQDQQADQGQEQADQGQEQQADQGQEQQDGQQQAEEGGEEAAQGENGGARRKLSNIMDLSSRHLANNQVVQMIDCDMCTAYECFEDAAAEAEQEANGAVIYDFDDAMMWLDGLSTCQQMQDAAYNNLPLYSGVICNAEGTGIEIGVFMDQDCTLYAPKLSYSSMMTEADTQYFTMTKEIVEYMFTNDFSCYQPDIQYTNPYQYQQNEEQAAADENQQQENPAAAEWCNNLFNGNMEAMNLANCVADEDGDQFNDENLETYDWYTYQISQDQANNADEVCQVVSGLNGEYSTLYDKSNGGSLYTYKKTKKSGMRPGGVATLVIFIILAAAAAAAFIVKKKKTSDKKTPLINESDGTLA